MSDFTVLRSLDGYCLVLDKKRIAGSKPDYRDENVLVDWTTEVAYGPVDDLAAENAKLVMKLNAEHIVRQNVERENAKLRELASGIGHLLFSLDVDYCAACPRDGVNHPCPVHMACGGECMYKTDLRELGVEV